MPEKEWNSETVPEEGAIVQVLAADGRGQYVIPFPVIFRDDCWWNARAFSRLTESHRDSLWASFVIRFPR
jgi:hypothetical protein